LVGLLLGSPQSHAQQATPATPAAPVTPPAAQATAPSAPQAAPDPKTLAAANELVSMIDMDTIFKSMFSIMNKTIMPFILRDNPNQSAQTQKIVTDTVTKVFAAHSEELARNKAAVYATVFSYDELEQLIAFYKSPVGQKVLKTLPQVMEQSMVMDKNIIIQIMQETQKNVAAALRQNGMKVPKEMGI
jgi:hypothetical protein